MTKRRDVFREIDQVHRDLTGASIAQTLIIAAIFAGVLVLLRWA